MEYECFGSQRLILGRFDVTMHDLLARLFELDDVGLFSSVYILSYWIRYEHSVNGQRGENHETTVADKCLYVKRQQILEYGQSIEEYIDRFNLLRSDFIRYGLM